MADRVLLEYVKQVYELESEQYTLTQIIDRLKQECSWKRNQIREEHVNYDLSRGLREVPSTTGSTAKIVIGIIVALGGLASASGIMVIYFIIAFFLIGIGISDKSGINKIVEDNARKRQENSDNADRLLLEIKNQNAQFRAICNQLEGTINAFEKFLADKRKALSYMYDYNIIHSSYRNFYGISKIYHLLDTGICDALTGVNGAYSQMRTDQIIDNQKISIELQKSLLATNQMMYAAINTTNSLMERMNQQLNINNSSNTKILKDIRENTEMTNFLIQSGIDSEKALTQSVEYLAYAEKQRRLADGHIY